MRLIWILALFLSMAPSLFALERGPVTRVSVNNQGEPANGENPSISADGRYVTFYSWANNWLPETINKPNLFRAYPSHMEDKVLHI